MYPKQHLILGFFFALILFLIFPEIDFFGFLIIVSASVLIDFDHYVYYIYKKGDFSLKNAYNWYVKNGEKFFSLPENKRANIKFGFCFLHGIEVIVLIFILFFFFKYNFLIFISTGLIFHQFLDAVELSRKKLPLHKVLSITYYLIYAKNKKLPEDII